MFMNASASSVSSRGGRWRRAVEGGSFMATMSTCIPIRNSPKMTVSPPIIGLHSYCMRTLGFLTLKSGLHNSCI